MGIAFLFIVTIFTPAAISYDEPEQDDDYLENLAFMCYDERGGDANYEYYKEQFIKEYSNDEVESVEPVETVIPGELPLPFTTGPMDSPWPMKCHDLRHTGQSPFSTSTSPNYEEKWRYVTSDWVDGSPVIGNDGVIYFGDKDRYIYGVYPNGTLKWSYKTEGWIWSAPAIADDGTVYVGSWDCYLYALNSDGSLKWKFPTGGSISSSPAIGDDGTVYFGTMKDLDKGDIFAVNSDGTEKWSYETGYFIASSPAIGDDGTIYIGSGDNYLYAMNPNGALKWRFQTGGDVKAHPSIADDGTIYFGSFDMNFYALNPNGTVKWTFGYPGSGANSASIASDGTIYICGDVIYALNPDGSVKWTFNIGSDRYIGHSSPAISADGTIYVGVKHGETTGGEIVVVNPDGTEKWRKYIANDWILSSPCIADDGTVYIGSSSSSCGYLHAFGLGTPNDPPNTPTLDGPTEGQYNELYDYTFSAVDPEGQDVRLWINWGDGHSEEWVGPFNSGEETVISYMWRSEDTYTISVRAEDDRGLYSDWAYLEVTMPINQQNQYPLLELFRERFPLLYQLFMTLLEVNPFDT